MIRAHKNRRNLKRFARHQRGVAILLAVGVLGAVSLIAVVYAVLVREHGKAVETTHELAQRASDGAQENFSAPRAESVVVNSIGALLTADLFGNKRMSAEVLTDDPDTRDVYTPRLYEDGDFADAPRTQAAWRVAVRDNTSWRNTADATRLDRETISGINEGAPPNPVSVNRYQVGPADDAWLASTEPVGAGWSRWRQMTNLRSAFSMAKDASGNRYWERGDGMFADLGAFFFANGETTDKTGRGDGWADLMYEPPVNAGDPIREVARTLSSFGINNIEYAVDNGPDLGIDQRVYEVQLAHMEELEAGQDAAGSPFSYSNTVDSYQRAAFPFEPSDERLFTDTDGDLRPDSRWTTLDELDGLDGLRWVVAARIIDASALFNVNAHLRAVEDSSAPEDEKSDGRTPADVDLLAFMRGASGAHPDLHNTIDKSRITGDATLEVYAKHVEQGLGSLGFQSVDSSDKDEIEKATGWIPGSLLPNANGTSIPRQRVYREAFYLMHAYSGSSDSKLENADSYSVGTMLDLHGYWGYNNPNKLTTLEKIFDGDGGTNVEPYYPVPRDPSMNSDDINDMTYPGVASLGPLRSGEILANARTYRGTSVLPNTQDLDDYAYGQPAKVDRIRTDVRRMLATHSGVAPRSPVPALNLSLADTGTGSDFAYSRVAPARKLHASSADVSVPDAFEAFVWALAPLATDVPLMAGIQAAGMNSDSLDDHYGGGSDSPANALSTAGRPLKASYAVQRAASLAVNMADAVDLDSEPSIWVLKDTHAPGNGELGLRFRHGDIDSANLPGVDTTGVSFVGLERQPFLVEALTIGVYASDNVVTTGSPPVRTITLNRSDDLVGMLFAVELGNPWGTEINIENYKVRIVKRDDASVSADFGLSGDIPAGETKVFYATYDLVGSRSDWNDEYFAVIEAEAGLDAPFSDIDPAWSTPAPSAPGIPSILHDIGGTSNIAPVLLVRDTASGEVLVDRLVGNGGEFPHDPSASHVYDDFLPGEGAVVEIGAGNIRRGDNDSPGFPGYVIERRQYNINRQISPGSGRKYAALTDLDSTAIESLLDKDDLFLFSKDSNIPSISNPAFPPFQLFVPDGPLLASSEAMLLGTFAHIYDGDAKNGVGDPATIPSVPGVLDPTTPNQWVTVSEQLGADWNFYYNGSNTTVNPYLGVLDPTRYVLGADLKNSWVAPDTLSVPLATRIVDVVDALSPGAATSDQDTRSLQGMVNLNTAPEAVIRALPFMNPTAGTTYGGNDRAQRVLQYRDAAQRKDSITTPGTASWRRGSTDSDASSDDSDGFNTLGEVAMLGAWGTQNGAVASASGGFIEFGANGAADDDRPLDIRTTYADSNSNPQDDPEERLAAFRALSNIASVNSDVYIAWFKVRAYDPKAIDSIGIPSRLRLPNGSIDDASPDKRRNLARLLNALPKAYEARYLCVFDRSNVQSPRDQPRVLLLERLPD